jgi:hypothetical protein
MLASQNSLACVIEDMTPATAAVADSVDSQVPDTEDSCSLCAGCAFCGGCCIFVVSPRTGESFFDFAPVRSPKVILVTSAPKTWAPPTLLRPPTRID